MQNSIRCQDGTGGGPKWVYLTVGDVSSSPCVADVDGDGEFEVLAGSLDKKVYCVDRAGQLEWTYATGGTVASSPCVADVDGDGGLEILVGSSDGKVYCLSVASAPINSEAYPWPSIGFHGDVRHTGLCNDTDGDRLTDNYEVTAGTDRKEVDTDTDGATDYEEFMVSTDPLLDPNAPAQITNLAAYDPTHDAVTLTWTAPGDNGDTGTATGYVVKYSATGPVNDTSWDSATSYDQSWTPQLGGEGESHVIYNLSAGVKYWFAIKAYDEVPNYSEISNNAVETTTAMPGDQTILIIGVAVGVGVAVAVAVVAIALKKKKK
jgi:hypothetical protein